VDRGHGRGGGAGGGARGGGEPGREGRGADEAQLEALVPEAEGDRYAGKWGQYETRV
jgi:hypothetical protein